ncbi:NYN domain-containing protein [Candidatus Pacearchaeota archaeon]|nr:NYN domain-containing protein [Candidatus Pacearchaeota archaeon]
MEKKCEKVIIFIDGSNVYHILKDLFPDKKPNNFNFEKFINYLLGSRKLVITYYYNAPLDRRKDENSYVKQQKFFDKIQRIPNFTFVLCRMQKRKVDGEIIYEVKEDDIHLAVDMVKLACDNAYDAAILVSSDGDFVPAIKAVKEKGKIVENIGFENKFSYHLQHESDRFIKLRRQVVENFFD